MSKRGRENENDDERLGRPRSAVNKEKVEIVSEFVKKGVKSSFQRAESSMLCFILGLWSVCW